MSERRLNLAVDEDIPDLLTALAGGERRRGRYLSDVIRGLAQTQQTPGADVQTLTFAVRGMGGGVAGLENRVTILENQMAQVNSQLATLIAESRA